MPIINSELIETAQQTDQKKILIDLSRESKLNLYVMVKYSFIEILCHRSITILSHLTFT